MFLTHHHQPISHNADHDRGHAVQHIGDKAHRIAISVAPVLGKKNTRANPQRNAEQAGNAKNDHRASDSVRHATTWLADRLRSLRQKGKIDRTDPLINQISKNREERQKHERDRKHGNARHRVVHHPPPQADRRHQSRYRIGVRINHAISISISRNASSRLSPSNAPHHNARQRINHNRDKEQRQSNLDQRGKIQIARRFRKFISKHAGHRVSRSKQRLSNLRTIPNHHRDRHGLAKRAAQAQNHGAHNSRPRIPQNAHADHLPPRSAQRQHRFPLVLRNHSQHFARNRRNNRNDHDRQNHARRQHPNAIRRSAEQARPAQRLAKKRLHIFAKYRHQNKDCPKSVNHAGDGSQKFGSKRKHSPQPGRTHFGNKHRHSQRQRNRDHQRKQRRHDRAVHERQRPVVVLHRIPVRLPKKLPAKRVP